MLVYWQAHLSQSFQINSKRRRAEWFEACCQSALLNVHIITLLFPFTVQKYIYPPVSKVHAGSSSCFRNPPNSDMDYMVFIVRTWSFLCVRIHMGVEHTDCELAQHVWLGKTHMFSCSPEGIRTSVLWILSLTLYQLSHPVSCLLPAFVAVGSGVVDL